MNDLTDETCDHRWDSDKEVRVCLRCGQVRTFPSRGQPGQVVWYGLNDKRQPTELPSAEKAYIATVARRLRIKKTVKITGIPLPILRAWVGRYTREKPLQGRVKKVKLSITMEQVTPPGRCFICHHDLFERDTFPEGKSKPCYFDAAGTRVWLCAACSDGVQQLLKLLGINCQVMGGSSEASQPGRKLQKTGKI